MRPEQFVNAQLDLLNMVDHPAELMRDTYLGSLMSVISANMVSRDGGRANGHPLFASDEQPSGEASHDEITEWLPECGPVLRPSGRG